MVSKKIRLKSGTYLSRFGVGTWNLGKDAGSFFKEVQLVQEAYHVGLRYFDAMRGMGNNDVEEILGTAFEKNREEVVIGTEIFPQIIESQNVYEDIIQSCEDSLERLKSDHIDILNLRGGLSEIYWDEAFEAFADLKQAGKIINFGVSHFSVSDLQRWIKMPDGKKTAIVKTFIVHDKHVCQDDLYEICCKNKMPLVCCVDHFLDERFLEDPEICDLAAENKVSAYQMVVACSLTNQYIVYLLSLPKAINRWNKFAELKVEIAPEQVKAVTSRIRKIVGCD